jgi:RNA polymerase sigma-70 factor (ECF subfamily)
MAQEQRALEGSRYQPAPNIPELITDRNVDEQPDDVSDPTGVSELVARAQRGDRDAFGDLYRTYHAAVFRLARFQVGDTAEDVVAETFTRAWAALPRYRDTGAPFVAWLYGIARHVVVDELRARKRVEARDELPAAHSVEPDHDARMSLDAAIARLPKRQRQVIEMKYLMGLTNPEVAAVLGKSVGAVNAQQWRALGALQEMLESR